jgi:DNA-binding winged helix-turn-helix (wHTH) protein/TolB-like protein
MPATGDTLQGNVRAAIAAPWPVAGHQGRTVRIAPVQDVVGDITFGCFRMDARRRALLVNGKTVPLHTRAYDVLECLVAHRDRVLSRDEITALVWRGMAIGENNLTVQISALRRALSQHGGDGLIVNFAGRGYRFVGDVTVSTAPAVAHPPVANPPGAHPPVQAHPAERAAPATAPRPEIPQAAAAPRRRRRLTIAAAGCAIAMAGTAGFVPRFWRAPAGPPRLSIVVQPFRNLTVDPRLAYLADAITDDLDTELARALKMQVIGRDSAVNVVQRHLSIQQIGRELNVRYVLDGSVQKTEAGYVVNPQLIDAQTGIQLWSVPFTVASDRFGDLRDIIVRRLAAELGYGVNALQSRLASEQRPDNPDALDLYYQAVALLDAGVNTPNLQAAAVKLQAAIDKQPDFADALAKLGWVLLKTAQSDWRADSEKDYQRAHRAIRRALDQDHSNPAVLAAYALELQLAERCPDAEHVAEEALQLTGSNLPALSVLTNCAWEQGHFDIAAHNLAAEEIIDPVSEAHQRRQVLKSYLALLRGDAPGAVHMLTGYVADHPDAGTAADPLQPLEYAQLLLMAAFVLNHQPGDAKSAYIAYSEKYRHRSIWRISALNTRAISNSPENAKVERALQEAGLDMFADEAAINGPPCTRDYDDFTPTPDKLPPPGQTLQTADMVTHFRHRDDLFVIDVGLGVAAYPGAKWADHNWALEDIYALVDHVLQARTAAEAPLPVIIMDTGPFGCAGYLAASHLLSEHVSNVAWYRGGEESWAHAGMPAEDHRKY